MALTREEVEAAAFWELDVCLDCPAIVQSEHGRFCPNCGSSPTLKAETVVKVLDVVKSEEEGE